MTFHKYGGSIYEPLAFDEGAGGWGTINTATIGPDIDFSVIDMLRAIHGMNVPAYLEEKKQPLNKLLLLVGV